MKYTKPALQGMTALLCICWLGLWVHTAHGVEADQNESGLADRIQNRLETERGQQLVERVLNHQALRKEHFQVVFQNIEVLKRKKWDVREQVFDEQQGRLLVKETEMGFSASVPAGTVVQMTNLETGEVLNPVHEGFTLNFTAKAEEPQSRGLVMSCLTYAEWQQRNPHFRLMVTAQDMKRYSLVHTPMQMLKQHIHSLERAEYKALRQELIEDFRSDIQELKRTLPRQLRKPAIALLRAKLKWGLKRAHVKAKIRVRRSINRRELLAQFVESPSLRKHIRFDVAGSVVRCQMGPVR